MSEREELYNIIGAIIIDKYPIESSDIINSLRKLTHDISIPITRCELPIGSTELIEILANIFVQFANSPRIHIDKYKDFQEINNVN